MPKSIENWRGGVQPIPEWRSALKMNSVQWMTVWSTIVMVWMLTPENDKALILSLVPFGAGERAPAMFALAGFVGGIFARLRAQPELHGGKT
jgi:hypothetical protein